MSYAEKNLAPGETIVHRARYHWIYYRTTLALLLLALVLGLWWWIAGTYFASGPTAAVFGTVALVLLGAAGLHFVVRRLRASADEYVVTSRRVIRKYGLVAREVEQALIDRIQDITVRQSVAGRLFGYGTVIVETASETGRIAFPDIADPDAFRNAIWGQAAGRDAVAAGTEATLGASPATLGAATAPPTVASRLAELEELRSRGLLSPEEYAAKREQILSSL